VILTSVFADRIQPIQLRDAVAGDADELAAHVVRGVLELACTSRGIQQGQREGGHAHSGNCPPERPHSRAGCQSPRQPAQRQSAAPAPVSGNVSDTLGTANITCTSSSVPGNGTCVKTQCASIFRARMRTAASSGSLPTQMLRLPPSTGASGDVDRDGGGRVAVDVVVMAADAPGVGSGVGSSGVGSAGGDTSGTGVGVDRRGLFPGRADSAWGCVPARFGFRPGCAESAGVGCRPRGVAYWCCGGHAFADLLVGGAFATKPRRKATSTLPVTNKIKSREMDRGVHHTPLHPSDAGDTNPLLPSLRSARHSSGTSIHLGTLGQLDALLAEWCLVCALE
jgi:hypothetical protein